MAKVLKLAVHCLVSMNLDRWFIVLALTRPGPEFYVRSLKYNQVLSINRK